MSFADHYNKTMDQLYDGYTSLAKWLISLAAGAIILAINKIELFDNPVSHTLISTGLFSLCLTIVFGVFFVRSTLDILHYDLMILSLKETKQEAQSHPVQNSASDVIDSLIKKQKERYKRIKRIPTLLMPAFTWSFIFGLTLVATAIYYEF